MLEITALVLAEGWNTFSNSHVIVPLHQASQRGKREGNNRNKANAPLTGLSQRASLLRLSLAKPHVTAMQEK